MRSVDDEDGDGPRGRAGVHLAERPAPADRLPPPADRRPQLPRRGPGRRRGGAAAVPRGHAVDLHDAALPAAVPAVRRPTPTETFEPYAVGYVELPGEAPGRGAADRARPRRLRIGQPMGLASCPTAVARADGHRRSSPSRSRPSRGGREHRRRRRRDEQVVIIGVGLHPFGRFPGKSAMDMGADAVRLALADAGDRLGRRSRAATSAASRSPTRTPIVGRLGLTGIPLRGVFNGCATAGTAVAMAARAIETGERPTIAIAIGMDKHPRGAFAADPSVAGIPSWYGADRAVPDHPLLRHEDQPLHARRTASPTRRSPGWRRRTSATPPATRRPGAARR